MIHSQPMFAPSSCCPSSHAATVVEVAPGRLMAAWFGGTHEGHPDVAIWSARFDGDHWSAPEMIVDEPKVPLWNPVLYRDGEGVIWLFFKAGPTIPAWTGLFMRSSDGGMTWSAPVTLPAGLLGPAKNKAITLSNGDILCGTSAEAWHNWAAWVEISADGGRTWTRHGPIAAPGHGGAGGGDLISATWEADTQRLLLPQDHCGVIQPTVWEYAPGRLKMLLRSTQRVGVVCEALSDDYGRTWSAVERTTIPHSNSGLDAVRLADRRIVLACNPVPEGRTPLSLLVSDDNGETWTKWVDLETAPGEYSYPSIIQAADGRVHVVYTCRRTHINHAVVEL